MNAKIPEIEIIHISIAGGCISKNHAFRHATVHGLFLTVCQLASFRVSIVQKNVHRQAKNKRLCSL